MSDPPNENVPHYLPRFRNFLQPMVNVKDIFFFLLSAATSKKDSRNLSEGKSINYKHW